MKNILSHFVVLLFIIGLVSSCASKSGKATETATDKIVNPAAVSAKIDPDKIPVMTFEKDSHDFGKLRQGEMVTFSFKFKNTGKSVLLITNVSTSCGCTVSDFPKEPILPGKAGKIDVSFNSEGKRGPQNKVVTIFANTQPNSLLLTIKAMVLLPDDK